MNRNNWVATLFMLALGCSSTAFAIEGGGGDRDSARDGPNWDPQMRQMESGRGSYNNSGYDDYDNMRARHQQLRDDDAERRMNKDFDVESRMNN